MIVSQLIFFFSSRRRHTRYWRDWSSDVCSSDLLEPRRADTRVVPGAQAAVVQRRAEVAGLRVSDHRRSEERRVGKECRFRWAACHRKKKRYVAEIKTHICTKSQPDTSSHGTTQC